METEAMAAVGLVFAILAIIFIPLIIGLILVIIARFKIYKKAGEEGWKCIIPYYNTWTECGFLGLSTNWVWVSLGVPIVAGILDGMLDTGVFTVLSNLVTLYISVLFGVSTAKAFGKDTGFAVGLILLPVVFYPILGFGKSQYVGANPMKDFVFKNEVPTTNTNVAATPQAQQSVENQILNAQPTMPQQKFCTNCGAPLDADASFCTSCGTKAN